MPKGWGGISLVSALLWHSFIYLVAFVSGTGVVMTVRAALSSGVSRR